jgi:hypothetical protein
MNEISLSDDQEKYDSGDELYNFAKQMRENKRKASKLDQNAEKPAKTKKLSTKLKEDVQESLFLDATKLGLPSISFMQISLISNPISNVVEEEPTDDDDRPQGGIIMTDTARMDRYSSINDIQF